MTWSGVDGTTRLAAVLGSPIAHSLSPAIHNAAFEHSGVNWRMVAFDVAEADAAAAVGAMRTLDIGGYAVTTPLKTEMVNAVDEVDPASAALNSVNTVVKRPDGTLLGASTDGDGFVASLRSAGVEPAGRRVAILGAGGAARSIIDALGRAGADEILVINRTAAAAEQAAQLAHSARTGVVEDVADADIVVNATTVGMGDAAASPLDDHSLLRPQQVVADIVYHPLETRLLSEARSVGATVVDGLGMLIEQARIQQLLWTGAPGDASVMRQAALAQLRRR